MILHPLEGINRMKLHSRSNLWCILLMSIFGYNAISELTEESLSCGGGAFIYSFILCGFVIAMPTIYMELFLAQYTKRSATMAWRLMPISTGVWYYLSITAYIKSLIMSIDGARILYFMVNSLQSNVPWVVCPSTPVNGIICYKQNIHEGNLTKDCKLKKGVIVCPDNKEYQLPTHMYLWKTLFDTKTEAFDLIISMVIYLLINWVLILLVLLRSMYNCVKLLKVFTLVIGVWFIVLTLTTLLPAGASDGIAYMFVVQKNTFLERKVMYRAAVFSTYYFSVAMPATMAFASRLKFESKPLFDAVVMVMSSCFCGLMYTLFNYAMMGVVAKRLGIHITELTYTKYGVTFGVVPYYMSIMVLGHVLLVFYYFLAFIISLLNTCICVSGVIQNVLDSFELREWRKFILAGYAAAGFLLVMPIMSKMGFRNYYPVLTNVVERTCILLGFMLETMVVFWFYATSRLSSDVLFFTKKPPTLYWKVMWRIIPAVAIVLFGIHISYLHDTREDYDKGAFVGAVVFCSIHVLVVPILGIIVSVRYFKQGKFTAVLKPVFDWGPPNKYTRRIRKKYHANKQIRSQVFIGHHRRTKRSTSHWKKIRDEISVKLDIPKIPMELVNKPVEGIIEHFRSED